MIELAKLASAFQILLFALVNGALIAFRESSLDWYDPEFVAPGYPYVQFGGGIACLLLITQMGLVPLLGAVGILLAGTVWYWLYGRRRTRREGAALDAVRRTADARTLEETQRTLDEEPTGNILVGMDEDTTVERERALLTVAANVAASTNARVYAVRFEAVPEQLTLSSAIEMTQVDRAFETETRRLAESLPAPIEPREVVSHNVGRAVVNFASDIDATLLLGEWQPERYRAELLGRDVDYYMDRAPCDVVFVRDRGFDDVDEIAVLARHRPYGPTKVRLANAFAEQADATLRFVTAVGENPTDDQLDATREFHRELATHCTVPVEIVQGEDRISRLIEATAGTDIAVVGAVARSGLEKVLLEDDAVRISSDLGCSVLLVHQQDAHGRSLLSRVVRRLAY